MCKPHLFGGVISLASSICDHLIAAIELVIGINVNILSFLKTNHVDYSLKISKVNRCQGFLFTGSKSKKGTVFTIGAY
jgi:hypothetical protein